jgi:hypothetical protein
MSSYDSFVSSVSSQGARQCLRDPSATGTLKLESRSTAELREPGGRHYWDTARRALTRYHNLVSGGRGGRRRGGGISAWAGLSARSIDVS